MITPVFRLEQDANFVTVFIKVCLHAMYEPLIPVLLVHTAISKHNEHQNSTQAPHIRTSEIDFYISDTEFKFYAKPYFLRLRFESEILEDGTETCKYDIDAGLVTVQLPKKEKGTQFEGLDLLTTLLAKKPTQQGGYLLVECTQKLLV